MDHFIWKITEVVLLIGNFLSEWLPTYFILGSLFLGLILSLIMREFKQRKDHWLSFKIQNAKNELKGKRLTVSRFKKLFLFLSQFYYPKVSRFVFLILAMMVVFGFCNIVFGMPYKDAEFYRSLVPIQIGIVALIFPIMIFIIGFSGNKLASGVSLSEVLLRESFLFPVGVIGLFFLVNLIWARSSCVVIVQIILSALMYAIVLFRVVRLLLNDKRLFEKSKALLRDKLTRSIEKTIEERLGNNILMNELGENKIELEHYSFDPERHSEEYIKFDLKLRGTIVNINLANLDKIAEIVEQVSRRNGFSFYKNILNLSSDEGKDVSTLRNDGAEVKTYKENKNRYLRKRFMDQVTDENPYVFSFKKELFQDDLAVDEIRNLVNKTFDVRKEDDEDDKLRMELGNLKDQLIDDIRNKRLGRISNLRDIYLSLAELFLDIMKSYSSNYTMEMARKERGNIFDEWTEVQWLTDDLRDIYEITMETHDRNIIQKVGYLPIAIANRAIKRTDHYIFQKSFAFLSIYYIYALREKDKDLQNFMKERCGIYLKETADHAVQYELNKLELGEARVSQYRDFAVEIMLQLQDLMKSAYDAQDLETFRNFVSIGKNLFYHFKPSEDHPDADHFRWQLKSINLNENERQRIEKELKDKEFLESIENEIKQKKGEMFFGLASLILDQYRSDKEKKYILEYFTAVSSALPSDIKELTAIFLRCHNFDVEDFWRWNWWILPMDGEVHSIDFLGKITFLYCVKAIQTANAMQLQSLEKVELPYNRDFVHMVEKDESIIKKTITDLLNESNQWDGVVLSIEDAKKNALFGAFDLAKDKQIKDEEDSLISSNLSQAKIAEFIKEFLEGYKSNSGVHVLFEKLGRYEDQTKQEYRGNQARMGYNRLDEKGAFVEGWYVHYSRWGEQYGSGIATSENSHLFEQLAEKLDPQEVTKENIINQIEVSIKALNDKNYAPNIIITSLDFDDHHFLSTDNRFVPHWHKDCPKIDIPNLYGVLRSKYGEIPVVRLYREKKKGIIGIFDLKKVATLIQFRPIDEQGEEPYVQGQFYIRILNLNEDDQSRNSIISTNPEWLNKYSDKDRFLRTKVIVKTFIRQELWIKDKEAGVLLKVVDEEIEKESV